MDCLRLVIPPEELFGEERVYEILKENYNLPVVEFGNFLLQSK